MKIEEKCYILFSVLTVLLFSSVASADRRPPNILYIFTDDQSVRSVGAYEESHSWVNTPNMDRLVTSGVRFTSCYTGAWCQPSRASALTGLLQHAHESLKITAYPLCEYDPELLPFWPAHFRQNGYETACVGKWHLGEDVGHGRDWDYSVIWDRGGSKKNSWAYYDEQMVRTNGGARKPLGGYSTDRYSDLAVEYIGSKNGESKPWFLWLCYSGVHGPFTPAERHLNDYADVHDIEVPSDIFGPRPTKPDFLKNMTRWEMNTDGSVAGFSEKVKKYHRAVRALDEGIGRVMDALENSGQLENTMVIFTSDQGYAWGQHGMKEKWMPYDSNLCAPLSFSWSGKIKPEQVCGEAVSGVDIVRTIHAAAGIQPKWPMHGRDLSPLLQEPGRGLDEPMIMVNSIYNYGSALSDVLKKNGASALERRKLWAWIMMRDGRYKYVRYMKTDCLEELYDLKNDPEELVNLAVNPEYREMLSLLREKALVEFKNKGGDFVDHLPSIQER